MNPYQNLRVLLILIVFVPWTTPAQETQNDSNTKAISYGFVSPNTEENLSLQDAINALNSAAERHLISETRNVGCRTRFKPIVMRAIGSWSDGAEHSIVFKTKADKATIRYAVASLGKLARQKAVLYFRQHRGGESRLHIIYSRTYDLFLLSRILDQAGIAFRTLVPLKHRTLVYVVDSRNELRKQITAAARQLRAQVRTLHGFANFLGNDRDRDQAQTLFDNEMRMFQRNHPAVSQKCAPLPTRAQQNRQR